MSDVKKRLEELANDVLQYLPWGEIQKDTAECIARRMVDHGVTVQEWIPASEPPKEHGWYLCNVKIKTIFGHEFYQDKLMWDGEGWVDNRYCAQDVTHWMSMPESPCGE